MIIIGRSWGYLGQLYKIARPRGVPAEKVPLKGEHATHRPSYAEAHMAHKVGHVVKANTWLHFGWL